MEKNEIRRVPFEKLKNFCRQAYERVGVPEAEAEIVADLLVRSDLRGVETHGVTRLPIYIQRLQKGYVRKEARITVVKEKGTTAYLDAHGSMGHIAACRGMEKAIAKAEEFGIGWVSVKDSGHFGVAGLFPMMALKKDFIGYVFTNSAPMMFPWGGRERIIGNNPLAYAIPAGKYQPVVLDFSLSVVPSGKLILSRKKGEKIPIGWAFDKNGLPTEDPYEGYEGGGSLAPVGGHKGYGLVLVHEMLTSVLTPAASRAPATPSWPWTRTALSGERPSRKTWTPISKPSKEAPKPPAPKKSWSPVNLSTAPKWRFWKREFLSPPTR
jgi:LDH2 family malate/lactate/ureidoglycolate dehydrogenase